MNGNGLVVGASAKVKKLTGLYSKYLTRPNREGIITKVGPKSVSIKFLHNERDRSYCHEHAYYLDDVQVTKHHKNSKRGKELEALKQEGMDSQERLLQVCRRHNKEIDELARDIRKERKVK